MRNAFVRLESLVQLDINRVIKTYREGHRAVDDVSLRVGPGVLGLLGPNGAGKSSLMRVLATITRPTAGTVTWDGVDVARHPDGLRRVLGYLPQDFGVYPNLSAPEFLHYLAAAKGLSGRSARARVQELLNLVNLADVGRRPLGKFSGGMRQRVGIAQALLNDPLLLIVDEPTVGLDPEERMRFRNLLGDLGSDRVVILSTHIVPDVEAVADDLAILAGGRLLHRGPPGDLVRAADGQVWELVVQAADLSALRDRYEVTRAVRTPDGVRVRVLHPEAPAHGAVAVPPDLEDAYVRIVRSAGRIATSAVAR
ncbi:ABC transporter ATP-binding protein [Promicromonospora vindobonensis]|uniref:ABC transporter ATP-binding protein n=1 Tax=Promicromonospora vindobonensis TaxID=195748 RepID=A0ABW5VYP4_9MICO